MHSHWPVLGRGLAESQPRSLFRPRLRVGLVSRSLPASMFTLLSILLVLAGALARVDAYRSDTPPLVQAVIYLSREVPRWPVENKCFSCHNNGDAARALYTARRLKLFVPAESLKATTDWLARPDGWDNNGGEGPSNDKRLARLQFTLALQTAVESGASDDLRGAFVLAARRLAEDQEDDGSWLADSSSLGSPATYGRPLATALARDILHAADAPQFAKNIERADRWLKTIPIQNTLDAAATLWAPPPPNDPDTKERRERAIALLRKGQSPEGGWGPFVTSAPEPFDTALAVLALSREDEPSRKDMTKRGRAYLVARMQADGSWLETTRPPGGESYAQRLSTAGWATLALLATQGQ
jgi:hypothetical protein